MRADARRNHDRLLAEARVAFARSGADASLEEIAHRAGVGSGTLYRHFPTREALLQAVIQDWTESMQAEAESFIGRGTPAEALHAWLRAYIAHATVFRGLAAALMAGYPVRFVPGPNPLFGMSARDVSRIGNAMRSRGRVGSPGPAVLDRNDPDV